MRGVHASDVSGTEEFIAAVGPQLIVVSEARSTCSGLVSEDWVSRCRDLGFRVWLQRDCGAVEGFVAREGTQCVGFLKENCLLRAR